MTIHLTADTEARVRSVAEERGQDPEEALIALLDRALAEAEAVSKRTLAALRDSVKDFAAGRWISLEDYEGEVEAKSKALAVRGAQE